MAEPSLENDRKRIAARVRELRRSRRWTQAELAKHLELSQSRLSELETGHGSFTAEQLLRVLALFNVGVEDFLGRRNDPRLELQNALARFGAKHLLESDRVVPPERLDGLRNVVKEVLLDGSPRLVTGLAPVLLAHAHELPLDQIYAELEHVGRERRLGWVVDNTLAALEKLVSGRRGAEWKKQRLRAGVVLDVFVQYAVEVEKTRRRPQMLDILDANIRTAASRDAVRSASSSTARAWGIVTSLRVEDFVDALRAAR